MYRVLRTISMHWSCSRNVFRRIEPSNHGLCPLHFQSLGGGRLFPHKDPPVTWLGTKYFVEPMLPNCEESPSTCHSLSRLTQRTLSCFTPMTTSAIDDSPHVCLPRMVRITSCLMIVPHNPSSPSPLSFFSPFLFLPYISAFRNTSAIGLSVIWRPPFWGWVFSPLPWWFHDSRHNLHSRSI
jgi:hypothetical protein